MFKKNIEDVFTPRNSEVNEHMYVERTVYEKELIRSVKGSMHSFLFGESGNGKSWLYKKTFSDNGIFYVVANCASASIKKSLIEEIRSVCVDAGSSEKTGYSETKKTGLSVGATAELAHQANYSVKQEDILVNAFKCLRSRSDSKPIVIVFDNVETIFRNEELMQQLSDVIVLLDDARYAKYNIKFLIVGVPNQVIEYFSTVKNASSVGNRIQEISRINGLNPPQIKRFLTKGFNQYLKFNLSESEITHLTNHVFDVTLGVPQRMHEYCECLAYQIEDRGNRYDRALISIADHSWLLKGLRENYTVIESHLNSDETSNGRRNQVIYCLGKNPHHQVNTTTIGELIEREFPKSAPESNSGIGQVLSYLTKGANPVLRKIANSQFYTLTDPRFLMCIRTMLIKDPETERVRKKPFRMS